MVRTVNSKYQVWLAGYYDDFTGARAIADDTNTPSLTADYAHVNSHHGNPLNGEATLNPVFRFSFNERIADNGNASTRLTDSTTLFVANKGAYEWLTYDATRQSSQEWEGRAQIQYPDGITNANRMRFESQNWAADAQGGYQRFVNGFKTSSDYIVPTGDTDGSYGRSGKQNINPDGYDNLVVGQLEAGAGGANDMVDYVQMGHLTGCWMGERLSGSHKSNNSGTAESPDAVWVPVKSPAGKPFLQVTSYHGNKTAASTHNDSHTAHVVNTSGSHKRPAVAYNGTLNSRGDGDVFTIRYAVRGFNGKTELSDGVLTGKPPIVNLYVGYSDTLSATDESAYKTGTNTAAIEWTMDFADNEGLKSGLNYDYLRQLYNRGTTKATIDNDDLWIDMDFVVDYTNNRYTVWCDGTQVTGANALGGSDSSGYYTLKNNNVTSANFTPTQMKGWMATVEPQSSAHNENVVIVFMVDRVGLIRPLSDAPDQKSVTNSWDMPPIHELKIRSMVNGISECNIQIADDPGNDGSGNVGSTDAHYNYQFTNLFSSTSSDDWMMLIFASEEDKVTAMPDGGRIDRPIWRGFLSKYSIKQQIKKRIIKLTARDTLSPLDRQVPMWELGQGSLDDSESATPYWTDQAAGWNEVFYMGASKLKVLAATVGFDSDDSYAERTDQRMQLNSGYPIQMYVGEDTYGPNDIEDEYEGYGIVAIGTDAGGSRAMFYLAGNPGYSTGSDITTENTASHDIVSSANPSSVLTYTNHRVNNGATCQTVTFDASDKSFTRATPLIEYAGEFIGHNSATASSATASTSKSKTWNFHFDTDPGLRIGDLFLIPIYNTLGGVTSVPVAGKLFTVTQTGSYIMAGGSAQKFTVQTDFKYESSHSDIGTYNGTSTTSYLTGNDRLQWSKDKGTMLPVTGTDLTTKAAHAVWMRDLSKSLWFQYHFGTIKSVPDATGTIQAATTTATTTIQIDATSYAAISTTGGLGQIVDADGKCDTFTWKAKAENGGDKYLIGVQFLSKAHDNGSTINICEIENDYKHCWVMWSDMRNNGMADADGGHRKTDFGLLYPTTDNYEISLYYNDQYNQDGEPDKFVSLALGEDVGLWSVDATNDPTTGGAFSKPCNYADLQTLTSITDNGSGKVRLTVGTGHLVFAPSGTIDYYVHIVGSALHDGVHRVSAVGGTNIDLETAFAGTDNAPAWGYKWGKSIGSETEHRPGPPADTANGVSVNTVYQDWEDKAGAFLVFDAAPFFNLNTTTNGGKTGQNAGGRTDLGDYVATVHGFPKLIDNYWASAMATFKNTAAPYGHNVNQQWCMSDGTTATNSIITSDKAILLEDATNFSSSGMGQVVATSSSGTGATGNRASVTTDVYISWDNCMKTAITGTATGGSTTTIVNSGVDFVALGVKVDMVVQNITTGQAGYIQQVGTTTLTVLAANFSSGNSAGNTYKIPAQISDVWGMSASHISGWAGMSPTDKLSLILQNRYTHKYSSSGNHSFGTAMTLNTTAGTSGGYDKIEVFNSVSSRYMLRLLMNMDGFIRSRNTGTYWESDKMRTIWSAGLLDTWMPRTTFTSMFDINNVPITYDMTTDGTASNSDSFGSVFDARTQTVLSSVQGIRKNNAPGINGTTKSFSYLMGRDGRTEYRPAYNSGWSLGRDSLRVSDLDADIGGQISHVRVYYNRGTAFTDFPVPSSSDTTKWKVLDMPTVLSGAEAEQIAKQEYAKQKEARLSIKAEIIRDATTTDKMLTGARYGYIADTTRMCETKYAYSGRWSGTWDCLLTGGMPFPGMCNALDGNLKTSTDLYNRYGQASQIDTTSTSGDIVNWDDNWYWYGANSISYAVQIVHVANGVPKVSATTGEELRVWVALKTGQTGTDIDNAEFLIGISDCSFSTSAGQGGACPTLAASLATNGYESVVAKGSGYYEIEVPTSYHNTSPQKKIVVSFNAEYCKALLRHRCGDPTGAGILHNAHTIAELGVGSWSATSATSIFPLGARKYTEMSSYADERYVWYAPRIHIVDDLNYVPATTLTFTDKSHDLTNETLVIRAVDWKVSGRKVEKVELSLERDESRGAGGLGAYLFPSFGDRGRHNPPGEPIPPAPTPRPPTGGPEQGPDRPPSPRPQGPQQPTPDDRFPSGGLQSSVGSQAGAVGLTGSGGKINLNNLTPAAYAGIKGKMDLTSDILSNQGDWGILGQKKPAPLPALMLPMEGMNLEVTPAGGMAVKTEEGFCLPGKGHPDETGYQEHSVMTTVTIPRDAVGQQISVVGTISCSPEATAERVANLVTTVTCKETLASASYTKTIRNYTDKEQIVLLPTVVLNGVATNGNEIQVKILRKPGTASTNAEGVSVTDNANEDSVTIHDLEVMFNRSAIKSKSHGNEFVHHDFS